MSTIAARVKELGDAWERGRLSLNALTYVPSLYGGEITKSTAICDAQATELWFAYRRLKNLSRQEASVLVQHFANMVHGVEL